MPYPDFSTSVRLSAHAEVSKHRLFYIVCDRPRHVRLDEENQLHAMSESAIEFADGWHSGYYQHGQLLPSNMD
jgi:hypothetical protein